MARNPAHEEDRLIPAWTSAFADYGGEPTIRGCTTHPHSEQFWEDPTYGVATYRRPHLCVVRRHKRPSPTAVLRRPIYSSNQRLHTPASDRRRNPGRLRASSNGRDAPPVHEVAARDDRYRISPIRVRN